MILDYNVPKHTRRSDALRYSSDIDKDWYGIIIPASKVSQHFGYKYAAILFQGFSTSYNAVFHTLNECEEFFNQIERVLTDNAPEFSISVNGYRYDVFCNGNFIGQVGVYSQAVMLFASYVAANGFD